MTHALPALTAGQMTEVARLMVRDYGIAAIQTTENAGRGLALLTKRLLANDLADRPIVVLAGRGHTGGGGLAAARHLLNWGAWVQVVCSDPPAGYRGVPARQLRTLQAMGAALAWAEEGWELPPCDLVVDAIVGCEGRTAPRAKARELIELANSNRAPILSLDAPSGVDAATGRVYTPHMRAAATLLLGLPKTGLLVEPARGACGDLYVADIGVPPGLYAQVGLDVPPIFAADPILAVTVVDGAAVIIA